jgi:hypothetical protein
LSFGIGSANDDEQQPALNRSAKGGLVGLTFWGLSVMLIGTLEAEHALSALGLGFVTVSALVATPRLIVGLALSVSVNTRTYRVGKRIVRGGLAKHPRRIILAESP